MGHTYYGQYVTPGQQPLYNALVAEQAARGHAHQQMLAEQVQCYGAIAYSLSTGLAGWSWRASSVAEAERLALSYCQMHDATVVGWGQNCCLCLAAGPGRGYGWAWHADATTAMNNALARCRVYEASPRVVAVVDTRRGALRLQ
jgi:hypothetical protein